MTYPTKPELTGTKFVVRDGGTLRWRIVDTTIPYISALQFEYKEDAVEALRQMESKQWGLI